MFNKSDIKRDEYMLKGNLSKCGYDWWWHSFTGYNKNTNEEKSFFIEFYLCNPSLGGDEPIFGQTGENNKPSYLMIKVGSWGKNAKQIHNFYGINKVKINSEAPFNIQTGSCVLSETKTRGKVDLSKEDALNHKEYMSDSGSFMWDLNIEKEIAFNVGYGAGSLFRKMQAFEMFWHAEGMKTKYSGIVIMDGEEYVVNKDNSYGYADKNWGKNFTSPWVWLSSNNLISKKTGKKLENSVFDIGGGRPKIYNIALNRKLLSAFYYEGKCFEFNFSKFWTFTRTKFKCDIKDDKVVWSIVQKNLTSKMITNIECAKNEMICINYESPLGEKRFSHLWNGGTGNGTVKLYKFGRLVDEVIVKNAGCEYGEFDK